MKSKWFNLKDKAITLRKKGYSIKNIESKLKIPRSTLSGWFKNVKLTQKQKDQLLLNWKNGLIIAQKKGGQWHYEQGQKRREKIRREVKEFTSTIRINKPIGELILATFYLAEGSKTENSFGIANSNPKILKGIINLLRFLYILDESKFRCSLHLRKDQEEKSLKTFWSNTLNIPESKFTKSQFDKRTIKKTYSHYKGVCVVNYFDMALQRRVLYIGDTLLDIFNENMGA